MLTPLVILPFHYVYLHFGYFQWVCCYPPLPQDMDTKYVPPGRLGACII